MKRQYFYLISGLPDIRPEAALPVNEILTEILEELHPEDKKAVYFLLHRNDNKNLLKLLRARDGIPTQDAVAFYSPAVFTVADLENILIDEYDGAIPLPAYLQQFVEEETASEWTVRQRENRLLELYYKTGISYPNSFIRQLFLFKQDLKNILLALNARTAGFKIERVMVGDYDLPAQLITSSAFDFGIGHEYPFLSHLAQLIENDQLLELEKEIDKLLLNYCEELVKLQPFSLEYVLYYVVLLSLHQRWQWLQEQDGVSSLENITRHILRRFQEGHKV